MPITDKNTKSIKAIIYRFGPVSIKLVRQQLIQKEENFFKKYYDGFALLKYMEKTASGKFRMRSFISSCQGPPATTFNLLFRFPAERSISFFHSLYKLNPDIDSLDTTDYSSKGKF